MRRTDFLLTSLLLGMPGAAQSTPPPTSDAYIEFLWTKTPAGAIARQETRSFALDRRFDHQVCVAILNEDIAVSSMELRAIDQSGELVSSRTYRDVDGSKRCFSADLPTTAKAGAWTYKILLNDQEDVVGERKIDVFDTVDALIAHTAPGLPYVLGRPNYDSSIPPHRFDGELVWIMHINRDGTVSEVDIESASGIGIQMQPKAVAAGLMSLFPPDQSRDPHATFRRHLSLRPDK